MHGQALPGPVANPSDPQPTVELLSTPGTDDCVSTDSYRTIFELASDAIFVHDVQTGAILDANKKACELYDTTLEELKAVGIGGFSAGDPPYDAEHAAARMREAAAGTPQRFEWHVEHRSGRRLWVEVHLNRVRILGKDRLLASVRNIDERKQAEEALRRSRFELEERVEARTAELASRTSALEQAEQRFRAIVESSPTPLLISRPHDGVILFANERLEALIGAEPGSLIGQRTPDYYYNKADRPRVLELIRRRGFIRDLELRIKHLDGSPRWTSISIQPLSFEGGDALATSFVDITQRRLASDALKASEESYRGLFDNLTELVYIQALDGTFLNVNDAVCRTYGYTCDELIGQTPDMLAAPGLVNIEQTRKHFLRAVKGRPQRFDWWGKRKDGSVFPKEVVLKRSTYFGQDVIIAVARDISERVDAEVRLRQSEAHFRRMIENASDLISIMDPQGVIQYQSPAITRILGYEQDELTGKPAFDFIAPEDVEPTLERWRLLHENPSEPILSEFRFRHKDGSWRYMEGIGAALVPDSIGAGIIVNSRDITLRKEVESTLRLQTTLLKAQGEASIDGIMVVDSNGEILSHNQRFAEIWNLDEETLNSHSDRRAIEAVLDQIADPEAFEKRVAELYANPDEMARDEILLRDGRVLDRYSAPVVSSEGEYYGRIWFFRDVTVERQYSATLERARRDAERARERASHYASSLERELEFGRRIQEGLFPAVLPDPKGWEIAVRFRPVWQLAGDFYDAFELPTGRLGLMLADVSGKGVGAALFMALFQSLLRASTERASRDQEGGTIDDRAILAEALASTNNYIRRVHRHAHMFASAFFGLLDPETGLMHYVNAGHEPPVLIGVDNTLVRLRTTGPAVGVIENAHFDVEAVQISPGDTLLAYTDGITEARNEDRDFFSEERLLEMIDSCENSAEALLERVDREVRAFVGEALPSDDVTMLAVRRSGSRCL
jgi:phosphoserine phosphatase RsbU/P